MIEIRRVLTHVEDIHHEFGPAPATPLIRGAIAVVLANPFAGRYERDLMPMMDALQPLGIDMAQKLRAAMDVQVERIEGYELLGWKGDRAAYAKGQGEHKTGQPGNALAIVPSTKKVGPPGASLDVPLTHINACYVRSHFDAIEVRVPGAPLADEIVYILTMSTGPRIHARVGGLKAADIAKWDGLR